MKRILIIRTSAIGDVVFASPFAATLRRHYPQAHIAWLVEPGIHTLLEADPAIDELILWPKGEWKTLWKQRQFGALWKQVRDFRRLLRSRRFDTAIDMQGLLKSGILAWWSGAPRRIGLGSREGSHRLMTEQVGRGKDEGRISAEYLPLVRYLGLEPGAFMPQLYVSPDAEARALARLTENSLVPGGYVVFAAFTTRPQKHWFNDAWQHLAGLIQTQTGMIPVLLGGPADETAAAELVQGAPSVRNWAGQTNLSEAAALVHHAGAVVGVDTGLTHMGIAFGVPTVAIFGSTCPYTQTCRDNARVIWLDLPCSQCRRNPTCGGAFTCLRDISAERVFLELEKALEVAQEA